MQRYRIEASKIPASDRDEDVDVIVVGGGPSGLMAAIAAQSAGAATLLVEKGHHLGRKLGISGGGRCNVTNAKPLPEFLRNVPGNPKFLRSALSRFSNADIMSFFEELGIRLKEEDRGRVFPTTDKAATVVRALVDKTYECGVRVQLDTPVAGLLHEDRTMFGVKLNNGVLRARAVILATGGCSVPHTGSTGDAYPWAASVGHTVVSPYPTEVPLTSDNAFIRGRELQGLSLRGTTVTLEEASGKRLTTEEGDLIFTHLGLSGPVALRCSHYVSSVKRDVPTASFVARIDCLPDKSEPDIREWFVSLKSSHPKRQIGGLVEELLPERLARVIVRTTQIAWDAKVTSVKNREIERLASTIKGFPIHITGTLPLAQATVTGGGIDIREINPSTMESKMCRGLYFCGEVMDVHAHTGGYNITIAFSTGRAAGLAAADFALGEREQQPV